VNSHQPVNPYIAGNPLTDTEMFYGRTDVFAFIQQNMIGLHRDQPIVLYGQRRTGKTSVLYQVHRHLDAKYRCIFMDLHGLSLNGMGNFMLGIANSICQGLLRDYGLAVSVPDRELFLTDPKPTFEAIFLYDVLAALGDDHLVLMLDELVRLDEEVRAGNMEHEVFDFLRHLMQHYPRLNFIFSLGSGLEELEKEYTFLFNVALYHKISFLEPAAARKLITEPVRDHYQVASEAVEMILQITSGHPYYTQLVCHCLFNMWSRSPKPAMSVADVDAVLSEAIERGSANLTYVWRDSTQAEQAMMAGLAAAMPDQAAPVSQDWVRAAWRQVGVSFPERDASSAMRSLIGREVVTGADPYSFAVDLQRLWLKRHCRLDWVKDDLADSVQRWNRPARSWLADMRRTIAARRYLAVVAIGVLLVGGYLAGAAAADAPPFHRPVPPFHRPASSLSTSLLGLMPPDPQSDKRKCRIVAAPTPWFMSGVVQTVRCTDSGLPKGTLYAFQLDNSVDFQTAWQAFNRWWRFSSADAGTTCPPEKTEWGVVDSSYSGVPQADIPAQECGLMMSGSHRIPAYAWSYPQDKSFIVAEAAPSTSFRELVDWLNPPPPHAVGSGTEPSLSPKGS
jgi:hypothetical protein